MRHAIRMPLAVAGFALLVAATPTPARDVTLTLPLPYRLVEDALVRQVFVGPGRTAQVLEGKNACNVLTLSEPKVESAGANRLRILATLTSRGGTPLTQGRCLPLFEWTGVLEASEVPVVQAGTLTLGFRVVDSNILARDGGRRAVPGVLWGWVKQNVHPRLESFSVDLAPLRSAAVEAVTATMAESAVPIVESIAVTDAVAAADALETTLTLQVPEPPAGWSARAPAPVLAIEELERWRATWQAWDAFATWLVKESSVLGGETVRDELAEILLEARHGLSRALAENDAEDPVPALFMKTWQRLAPVLRRVSRGLPAEDALRLLSLIGAADALQAIDSVGPHFGFRADRDSLRRLARILAPAVDESALDYTLDADPDLRRLLGLDPEFPLTEAPPRKSPWRWLIADATAAAVVDPALVQRLNGWVPTRTDLDAYLVEVEKVFAQVALAERQRGKIKPEFAAVYAPLLHATAWQETCWRQFIAKSGKVQTIRSVSGSVGIMQVNTHVWRGVYDVNGLLADVGYNARAGNEILVHYLVDYAVRRGEHKAPGGTDNLARATYAVYNGGPGHLTRYRERSTRESLRRIDAAFFDKFETIRREGTTAVKQCFGG